MWLQVCYVVARGMSAFCSIEFDSKMCAVLRALHCCCCRRFLFCDPWKARKIKWLPPFSIFHQLTYLSYLPRYLEPSLHDQTKQEFQSYILYHIDGHRVSNQTQREGMNKCGLFENHGIGNEVLLTRIQEQEVQRYVHLTFKRLDLGLILY